MKTPDQKTDERIEAAKKLSRTGNRKDLQNYLRLRLEIEMRNYRGKPVNKSVDFVYGCYIKIEDAHFIIIKEAEYRWTEDEYLITGMVEVIPETVSQQVGLKDKHGKEMYGGDIVLVEEKYGEDPERLFPPTRSVAKLFGWGGKFGFVDKKNSPKPYQNKECDIEIHEVGMAHTCQNGREIIGNIHSENKKE